MLNFDKPFYKIIKELCEELNIEVKKYSFDYFWQLQKDGKIRNMMMHKLDLNSFVSTNIANDKYATYTFLKSNNIPIITHHMIFNPKTRKDYVADSDLEMVYDLFEKYNEKIVIKANDSFQGKEVYLVEKKEEIPDIIHGIFSREYDSLSICPFEKIKNEYRMVVLDNECLFGYKKELPRIVGDGKRNLSEFASELNIENPDSKLDLNYVPKLGEEVCLAWKFNLSGGALPKAINNFEIKEKLEEIANSTTKIMNIRFASVDIIENQDGEFKVMEVNGTVCMNKFTEKFDGGYEIVKDIYRKVLNKMFE